MASINEKVDVEFKNIRITLEEINKIDDIRKLSTIELGGLATFLHNFYNGIENIIKQVLKHSNISIPNSSTWHKDLVTLAYTNNILTEKTFKDLQNFLFFRHFFIHGYAIHLDPEQLLPLVESSDKTFNLFIDEINSFLQI